VSGQRWPRITPALEVVVIDDGSTDRTAAILESLADPRLRVIDGAGAPPPAGWLGKPWANHRAAAAARGDWLLFTDADVELGPRAVSVAVGAAERLGLDLLTGLGTELAVGLAEKVLHTYVLFGSAAGTDWRAVNDPSRREVARGNGRFLLVRRDSYHRIGGFESVRGLGVDDEAFARRAKRHGLRYRFCFVPTLYRCRMFHSARELWNGWRRLAFSAVALATSDLTLRPLRMVVRDLLLGAALVLAFAVFPYLVAALALGGLIPGWLAVAAAVPIGLRQTSRVLFDRKVGFPSLVGLVTHWLANLLMVVLLADAARAGLTGRILWRGRPLVP
jgi:glycosyltransferase involved in cell wall biosynthesis